MWWKSDITGYMLSMTTMLLFVFIGVGFVTSISATAESDFPPVDQLAEITYLPDPFLFQDGARVATPEEWRKRREEIVALVEYYEYGLMPPSPGNITAEEMSSETVFDGKALLRRAVLTMGPEQKFKMTVALYVPVDASTPLPVLSAIEPVWDEGLRSVAAKAVDRGYIFAGYDKHELDEDNEDRSDGVHPLYPEYDWATLAAWAWGAMRLVDYLYTQDIVDKEKIALTGHSRAGKTALLAAALDERIALVAPHGSGAGGAGCFRLEGHGVETLSMITQPSRFHYWFHPRFRQFTRKETRLPFDQHFMKALIAPRVLVCMEGLDDLWANPLGSQQSTRAAQPVFDFLDASGNNAFYCRPGGHDMSDEDWDALLAYCDHYFLDKPVSLQWNTFPFPDEPLDIPWTAPSK